MKLRTIAASIVVSVLLMGSQAFAHITIFGGTGLVLNPTADVVPAGRVNTQFSYWKEEEQFASVRGYSLSGAFRPCFHFCGPAEFYFGFLSSKAYGLGGYTPFGNGGGTGDGGYEPPASSRVLRQGVLPATGAGSYTKVVSAGLNGSGATGNRHLARRGGRRPV